MSKAQLKKYLKSLTQEQLIQVILDTYDARKESKEYLEYFMNPDDKAAHEKARNELYPIYFNKRGKTQSKLVMSNANKIVNDFIKLEPSSELVADLLLYNVELYVSRLSLRYIVSSTAWSTLVNHFRKAVDYAQSYSLADQFKNRVWKIVKYTENNSPSYLNIPARLIQEMEECEFPFSPDINKDR